MKGLRVYYKKVNISSVFLKYVIQTSSKYDVSYTTVMFTTITDALTHCSLTIFTNKSLSG